jgi:catechol 2,3-dioxygenase-like lactoylglutathione lyase family enzyme
MEPTVPQLQRVATYLPVADLASATAYYEDALGFRREYVGGSPPVFAILSRDGHTLMLRLVSDPSLIVPNERQGGTWDVFFWVRDVHELHAELVQRGATAAYGVVYQSEYHMDECAFRDIDGHVLGFGQARTAPGG